MIASCPTPSDLLPYVLAFVGISAATFVVTIAVLLAWMRLTR